MSQPLIDLQHISKSFDGEMVLDDLNLSIKENSFVTLLGPSGCGKSTTLRILGGFTPPDKGNVIFDGQDITKLPPNKRQLNTVFQKYALFPHLNVFENVEFGLKIKKQMESVQVMFMVLMFMEYLMQMALLQRSLRHLPQRKEFPWRQ